MGGEYPPPPAPPGIWDMMCAHSCCAVYRSNPPPPKRVSVEKVRQCRAVLTSMPSKQFHLHTVNLYCFTPLLDHLIQSCCPEDLQEALRPFGDVILTTAKLALGLDLADQIALRRARLPPSRSDPLLRQRGGLPPRRSLLGRRPHRRVRPLQIGPARLGSSRSLWTWWVQAPLSRAGGNIRTSSHAKVAAWQMS
jgi:hypothetical protein